MSWLISNALMNSLSLQGLAVESLGDISLDGEQSVQSSGKPTPQAYLSLDKMTDFSRLSRFGMTFKPLTDDLGEALLMSYREAFLAKTSPLLEKGQELMESEAECGEKWHGSLAKFDQHSSLWKTHQCSLIEDSTECLETFPNWGLMRNGELWEQIPLVHPTEERDFGFLPTPTASDQYNGNTKGIEYRNKRIIRTSLTTGTEFGAKLTDFYRLINGRNLHPTFAEWMMNVPLGWTDLNPLEMPKFQEWLQPHGES